MSWDATLYDDRGHTEGEWNCTHNINRMANAVIHPSEDVDIPRSPTRPSTRR